MWPNPFKASHFQSWNLQFIISTVQHLHWAYPPESVSMPSSQAAHTQPLLQPLLRSTLVSFSNSEMSVSMGQPLQTADPTGHRHTTFMFRQGSKETCWDEFLRTITLCNHCTMAPQPSTFFACCCFYLPATCLEAFSSSCSHPAPFALCDGHLLPA